MTLTKMVNGERITLSEQEEIDIRTEWTIENNLVPDKIMQDFRLERNLLLQESDAWIMRSREQAESIGVNVEMDATNKSLKILDDFVK